MSARRLVSTPNARDALHGSFRQCHAQRLGLWSRPGASVGLSLTEPQRPPSRDRRLGREWALTQAVLHIWRSTWSLQQRFFFPAAAFGSASTGHGFSRRAAPPYLLS